MVLFFRKPLQIVPFLGCRFRHALLEDLSSEPCNMLRTLELMILCDLDKPTFPKSCDRYSSSWNSKHRTSANVPAPLGSGSSLIGSSSFGEMDVMSEKGLSVRMRKLYCFSTTFLPTTSRSRMFSRCKTSKLLSRRYVVPCNFSSCF
jgi:hypothetical protein